MGRNCGGPAVIPARRQKKRRLGQRRGRSTWGQFIRLDARACMGIDGRQGADQDDPPGCLLAASPRRVPPCPGKQTKLTRDAAYGLSPRPCPRSSSRCEPPARRGQLTAEPRVGCPAPIGRLNCRLVRSTQIPMPYHYRIFQPAVSASISGIGPPPKLTAVAGHVRSNRSSPQQ